MLSTLMQGSGLKTNIHDLLTTVSGEMSARYANRVAPGYEDAQKERNAIGDLLIWKELLNHCATRSASAAVLVTGDAKADWVYTPQQVVLPSGVSVGGTNQLAAEVKLPRPDLLAEFQANIGCSRLFIGSMEYLVQLLASSELNPIEASDFRNLSWAIKWTPGTPTEHVIQWFWRNPEKISEAVHGVCHWIESPDEVDMDAFAAWTCAQSGIKNSDKISWQHIFCEFFL